MLTIFSKYKVSIVIVLLFFIVLELLSLAVQKLFFLTDIELINALVNAPLKGTLQQKGIDHLIRFTNLLVISGFTVVLILIIVSVSFAYQIYKYRFHWLNSLLSLLLVWGLTLYNSSKKGWHTYIGFWEIPGHFFKNHPYQYFLFNGLLYLVFATIIFKICMLYIRTKTKGVES